MPSRRTLLRVMLWSLGLGALVGVAAILAGNVHDIWRVSLTAFVTAVAVGLMIPVSMLMDKPAGRQASMLGMWAILLAFLLAMLLTWDLVHVLPIRGRTETVALTLVFVLLCSLPAMFFLVILRNASARVAGSVGLILTAAVFAALMIGTWGFLGTPPGDKWFSTAGAAACLGLLAVASLVRIEAKGPGIAAIWLVGIRLAGAIAAGLALAVAVYAIWFNIHRDSGLLTTLVCIAAVIAHANLCLLVPLTRSQEWVRAVTIGAAFATAVCIDLMWVTQLGRTDRDLLVRLASASALAASCGSLALLVLARINRRIVDQPPVLQEIREITLICPGCHKTQTLTVGDAACPTCRLRIRTSIHEPRCPKCEYLLFMLTSDRCPECGEPIEQGLVRTEGPAPPANSH
ncbi:MAG: hypothetical protein QUV05_01600 [Phycisphaerae bacterium]|nr:hypothetical protein [Phycisphaerae bacterium]